ncbi:MAG: hypothetical protein NZL87_00785, partial [Thermomicrobium sp.]|nr:hypothetical protein [Thermomicrobium sp.]
ERLGRVEEETRELRQAIQELTEAVKQLARKSAEHDRKLDRFSFLIGVHLEREASVELVRFFEAEGWKLVERPRAIAVNGEFDVVARFMRGEESVWVIIETKARVYPRDITDFASKLQSSQVRSKLAARGLQGTVLAYLAGGNIEQQVDDVCRALGVGLIDVLGIVLHPQPFTLD